MKNLILLCALVTTFSAQSAVVERSLMLDYVGTDMDRMFEIKTSKYDKVILDCQTFIHGLNFYRNSSLVHNFYLEIEQCEDLHEYLTAAKKQKVAICFEIEDGALDITERFASECL